MPKLIDRNTVLERVCNSNRLYSPPQILIRLLDTRGRRGLTPAALHQVVTQDPVLSIKLILLVASFHQSSLGGKDVPTFLHGVDPETIQHIAIHTATQFAFERDGRRILKKVLPFWQHSLRCALVARGLAADLAYDDVERAYFAGLLHDIGKLMLHMGFPDVYDSFEMLPPSNHPSGGRQFELEKFGVTHDEIGAWVIRRAGFDPLLADAVHYHHDSLRRIQDASLPVKILFCANRLCFIENGHLDADLKNITRICPLPVSRIDSIVAESNEELNDLARKLDIQLEEYPAAPQDSHDFPALHGGMQKHSEENLDPEAVSAGVLNKIKYLTYEVRDFAMLCGTLQNLMAASGRTDFLEVIQCSVRILFGVQQTLIFLYEPVKQCLNGPVLSSANKDSMVSDFCIDCRDSRTLLSRAVNDHMIQDSFGQLARDPGSIVDEQIIHLMGTEGSICLPLAVGEEKIGVLVLGVMHSQFQRLSGQFKLLHIFAEHAALWLHVDELKDRSTSKRQAERLATAEKITRNVVREVNNPLGVMRNHLHLLSQNIAPGDAAHRDIEVIAAEIQRVAQVMDQLSAFSRPQLDVAPAESIRVGEIIAAVIDELRSSAAIPLGIDLRLELDTALPPVPGSGEMLRTILQQLLANAVDALGDTGEILLRTRRIGPAGQRPIGDRRRASGNVEIVIQDNGPGIPESIRGRLFEPHTTTKGGAHRGMGLSLVQNLIKQLRGHIICETDSASGTMFRIILALR